MPLILPGNVASATADAGYSVANSCRFNNDDGAYMHKTPGGAGNRKTWTISVWVKKSLVGGSVRKSIIGTADTEVNGNGGCLLRFENGDALKFESDGGVLTAVTTSALYRDPSAWMHVVLAVDTTQGTAGNRVKIYINGVQETSLSSTTYPDQNKEYHWNNTVVNYVGAYDDSGSVDSPFDGYMAEFVSIDGQALTPTSFGEFDEDSPSIWKPKDVSELTFGTNGFYLDFEASDNLGNDANGGTDLTEANLAAVDQATDSPTNNFCTMNPLDNFYAGSTFSEGNCRVVTGSIPHSLNTSTFGVSAGKWYCEITIIDEGSNGGVLVGITDRPSESASTELGELATSYAYNSEGHFRTNNGNTANSVAATDGDIIGIALNLDDNEISYYKNNVLIVAAQSITAPASTENGVYFIASSDYLDNDTTTNDHNFGNPVVAHSSAANDASGYGSFEYAPPSGFLALCTKNLGSDGG